MRWLLSLGFLLCGCGGSSGDSGSAGHRQPVSQKTPVMDSANAAGYRLTLLNKNGACVVQFEGQNSGQSSLLPKPPCYFLRRESEHPQSFSYPDVRTQAVLIVVGTAATEKTRKLWKLPPDLVCGEEIQAVLVRENAVRVSKEVRDPGVACRDKGVDEKEFWAFAHDEP